jgi:Na+/H+-dicarboxylate symporter
MITLLGGILAGCILGLVFGKRILFLEAAGNIFLNLLFTVVVPLVFFAIASAIAGVEASAHIGRIARMTVIVLVGTVLVSAFITMVSLWIWPLHAAHTAANGAQAVVAGPSVAGPPAAAPPAVPGATAAASPAPDRRSTGDVLTQLFTVQDFFSIFSRKSMLALIVLAVGTGFATLRAGDKGKPFKAFLTSGNEVMQQLLSLVMYTAPFGLGAYFACQVANWGGGVLGAYGQAIALLSGVSIFYYIFFFSLYAVLAGGRRALKAYWKYNVVPSATALGTSSSIAAIPANLEAAGRMRIPPLIANLVIPIGGPLHKEGSAICEVVKVYLLFALFHPAISPVYGFLLAMGLAWLVSIVEGGIPNGGYIGEVLTLSVLTLPPEALPPIILLGTVTDPISTVVNATGDTASAMLIARLTRGKRWMDEADSPTEQNVV